MYPASGIESQIRTLADYAFMLRDYETAKSMYSMVKEDFKADKVCVLPATRASLCLHILSAALADLAVVSVDSSRTHRHYATMLAP